MLNQWWVQFSDFLAAHLGWFVWGTLGAFVVYRTYFTARAGKRAKEGGCARCGRIFAANLVGEQALLCPECAAVEANRNRVGVYGFAALATLGVVAVVWGVVDDVRHGLGIQWETIRDIGLMLVIGPASLALGGWRAARKQSSRGSRTTG